MKSIRRDKPSYGIVWSELYYDGKNEGQFRMRIVPDALTQRNTIATVSHIEKIRIAVGVHPQEEKVIVFVSGTMPAGEIRQVYKLPGAVTTVDGVAAHDLEAAIADGKIYQVTWNGQPLEKM